MFSSGTLERLQRERIIWLTTVSADGRPQTSPVWYLFDGDEFIVYSLDPTRRLDNIAANPHVALNLDGNGSGGDIVTIEGTATVDRGAPGADSVPEYVERYRDRMDRGWGGPAGFAAKYPTLIRITPTRARQW
jgi:PPOX class probable F420-dependent enzyme